MVSRFVLSGLSLAAVLTLSCFVPAAQGVTSSEDRVIEPVNDRVMTVLRGNTRPEALNPENDRGMVGDNLLLDHMLLLLKRSPTVQTQLDELVQQQNEPGSPNYHKWLTTEQFGSRFGVSESDITQVTSWLESRGFTVQQVYPDRTMIDFSGTAGAVREAFRTEIHALEVNGASHIANISDPQIPSALAGVVSGVVSMNDFRPHPIAQSGNGNPHRSPVGIADAGQ